ncbi:unnamed protein product [Alopecurus aequalis]
MPRTVLDNVTGGCGVFVVGAVGGSVFYFVKGTLRSSSSGCRLAGGIQTVITNGPCVRRWAAWSGVLFTVADGICDTCHVGAPLNVAVGGGVASTLFSMHRGTAAAVRSGLKGAAYSGVAAIAICTIVSILDSRKNSG